MREPTFTDVHFSFKLWVHGHPITERKTEVNVTKNNTLDIVNYEK